MKLCAHVILVQHSEAICMVDSECCAYFRYIPCWGEYDDCSRIMRRWGGSMVHTALSGGWVIWILDINITFLQSLLVPVSGSVAPVLLGTIYQAVSQAAGGACHLASSQHRIVINWYKHSYKRPPAHYQQFLRAQFATQTSQTCVSVVCVSAFLSVVISVSLRQNMTLFLVVVLLLFSPAWLRWWLGGSLAVILWPRFLMCVCLKSQ